MTNNDVADNSAGTRLETPVAYDKDGVPMRVPAHGYGMLRQGNSGQGGAPTKKEAREKVLGLMDGPAFERDKAILTGWCLCPDCKEKWEVPERSDTAYEGAANRQYRFGLGLKDEVQLQDREAFLRSLARATVRLKYSDADSAKLLEVVADELGIE